MARNGLFNDFRYGPNDQRFEQKGGGRTVLYIDKLYERINTTQHKDRLSSVVPLSTELGNLEITATRHFDRLSIGGSSIFFIYII